MTLIFGELQHPDAVKVNVFAGRGRLRACFMGRGFFCTRVLHEAWETGYCREAIEEVDDDSEAAFLGRDKI